MAYLLDTPAEAIEKPACASLPGGVQELTSAILKGSEVAFNEFYAAYSPRVYRLLLLVTRGDEELSRELHQCVMIKAARKLKVFSTESALWAWLAEISRNTWRDSLRRKLRQQQVFMELQRTEIATAGESELLQELQEALASLDSSERELIQSFYLEERAQAELAKNSGRSVKAIQCQIYRIREKLRKVLRK